MRDVSGVLLPAGTRWGSGFDVCPFCGRLTPRPETLVGGRWVRFAPLPCDCPGAAARRAEYDAAEALAKSRSEAKSKGRERFDGLGIDATDYADCISEGMGVYLYGSNGTGKTSLSHAIARTMEGMGWRVWETSIGEIVTQAREYGAEEQVYGRAKSVGLLVLDDLGQENPTAGNAYAAFRIVNDRYAAKKPLAVTSNYSIAELGRRLDQADLGKGKSVSSRLGEMCLSIPMDGADRRIA